MNLEVKRDIQNKQRGNDKMKKTLEIIKMQETNGDKFFTVEITNQEGEKHTDIFSEATLMKAATKVTFEVAEDEELQHEVSELGFFIIAEDIEGETEKSVFDIYFHKFNVEDGEVEFDAAGEFVKTYKTQKAAQNFTAKQGFPVL
jgi:hypothetical protein